MKRSVILFLALCISLSVQQQFFGEELVKQTLEWGENEGHISKTQKELLWNKFTSLQKSFSVERGPSSDTISQPNTLWRLVHAAGSKITLLNVLYFGGTLLVIGAMTLFMTLGFERFGGFGLFVIATLYFVLFTYAGHIMWLREGYQLVGGLLCTIAISMTPLGVYGIQRMFGVWGKFGDPGNYRQFHHWIKGSYIWMEMATVAVASGMLYFIRFPFLVAPIAFCLWYFSMDIAPWIGVKMSQRRRVSIAVGASIIAVAVYVDSIQQSGDFAFWLFLFGLITFNSGLSLETYQSERKGCMMLSVCVLQLMMSQYLGRDMFTVFGFIHIAIYFVGTIPNLTHHSLTWMYVKWVITFILYTLSFKAKNDAMFWLAVLGIIHCNSSFVKSLVNSFEFNIILHFVLNFIFASCAHLFNRDISMWLLSLNGREVIFWLGVFGASLFHLGLLKAETSGSTQFAKDFYCWYRLAFTALWWICAMMTKDEFFMWVGAAGITAQAAIAFLRFKKDGLFTMTMFAYIPGVVLLFASSLWASNVCYIIGCIIVATFLQCAWYKSEPAMVVMSVQTLMLSVLLNSQLLLIIAGLNLFAYLSYISWTIFKNSLFLPLLLTLIGICVIYAGVQYQHHQTALQQFLLELLPPQLLTLLDSTIPSSVSRAVPSYATRVAEAVHLLANTDPIAVPVFLISVVAFLLLLELYEKFFGYPPVDVNSAPVLKLTKFTAVLAKNTDNHGIIFKIEAKKPADFTLSQGFMLALGTRLWLSIEHAVGSSLVTMFKMTMYPLSLCPTRMNKKDFIAGKETVSTEIQIGTGLKGERRISHGTILSKLSQLQRDIEVTLQVHYHSKKKPYSGVLFRVKLTVGQLLQALQTNSEQNLITKAD